jgi:uncharacterized YccA/Bax inhibitor family protein
MTLQGTINKSFLLLVVLLAARYGHGRSTWPAAIPAAGAPAILVGAIGGLVLALIISFKATMAPYLSLPYAACEGLAIGGISARCSRSKYPGIAIQAVGLTFGVLAALLLAYTHAADSRHAAFPLPSWSAPRGAIACSIWYRWC